jgi:hypothetical protein
MSWSQPAALSPAELIDRARSFLPELDNAFAAAWRPGTSRPPRT